MCELNLSLSELKGRTSAERFKEYGLLKKEAPEYTNLSQNEKDVLSGLLGTVELIDQVHFKLENINNEKYINYLNKGINAGDERAKLTAKLFYAQKSAFSPDREGRQISLFKGDGQPLACAFYPIGLTSNELSDIINKMLDRGEVEKVKKILSSHSVVFRDGDELTAYYYEEYFKEFNILAAKLKSVASICKDVPLKNYLLALAEYFICPADENLLKADTLWVELDSKIEYCVTRESYEDGLTSGLINNRPLYERLTRLGITVTPKDSIGLRIGIVNAGGTKFIKKLETLIDVARKNMPLKERYDNGLTNDSGGYQAQQDVDIVALAGDEGAYRAGVVLAQNLPNNDKLCAGKFNKRKNIFHRQFRSVVNMEVIKTKISQDQLKFHSTEAEHIATICHENTHSLGPKNKSCGKYTSILEEFKADLGAIAFLNEYVSSGVIDHETAMQIVVSNLSGNFLKAKPSLSQAHRVRSVMYANILLKAGAIELDAEQKLVFNYDKVVWESKKILEKIIQIQLNEDVLAAENFVNETFVWTSEMETVAARAKKADKVLNGYVKQYIF